MKWTQAILDEKVKKGTIKGYVIVGQDEKAETKSKYGNKKIVWNGIKFDSKLELARYQELLILERGGFVKSLQRQIAFELVPKQNGLRSIKYIADHVYFKDGIRIVEDVKSPHSVKLPTYVHKKKLMKQVYGIDITEYLK